MAAKEAGAVLIDGKRVLVRLTANGDVTFPKGHIEEGESPAEAAQRELMEETGMEGTPRELVHRFSFVWQGEEHDLSLFRFELVRETEAALEHLGDDAEWLTINEAMHALSFPDCVVALKKAARA